MIIDYLGKQLNSISFDGNLEPEKIEIIKQGYFNEDKELALKQLESCLLRGTTLINHIYAYYFERVAADTLLYTEKWTINQVLQNDQLIQLFINRTYKNEKIFKGGDENLVADFKTAIRLGGKGIVKKPSNFPLKECLTILSKLSEDSGNGKTYIDPCCGWGVRLLAAAMLDLNYIGFDVNANLVPKLNELAEDIKKIKPSFNYYIFPQGSQYFVEDLVGIADFTFTSPPYFNLEDYGNNDFEKENSYRGVDYSYWLDHFVDPLVGCLVRYVKPKGIISFNIKDFAGYTLEMDFTNACTKHGLNPFNLYPMKNIVRNGSQGSYKDGTRQKKVIDNSEWVYVFQTP